MVKKWVHSSFKLILLENCQAYLDSNDLGKHKAWTLLISEVAQKIREAAAPGSELPGDLNKVSTRSIFKLKIHKLRVPAVHRYLVRK